MGDRLEMAARILNDIGAVLPGREVARISRKVWDYPLQICLSEEGFSDYIDEATQRLLGRARRAEEREKSHKITCNVLSSVDSLQCLPDLTIGEMLKQKIDSLPRLPADAVSELTEKRFIAVCCCFFGVPGLEDRVRYLYKAEGDDRDVFPLKQHPGARTKVNIFFRDACLDLVREIGVYAVPVICAIIARRKVEERPVFNDEATAWLNWCYVMWLRGCRWEACTRMPYKGLKTLSDEVKGMGVACNPGANLYVEMVSLAGRAVASIDVETEMRKRCDSHAVEGMLAKFDSETLRRAVRRIVLEERGDFSPPDCYESAFKRRFATTKAGSHHAAEWSPTNKLKGVQMTRRNYIEGLADDTLNRVKPGGWVSFSEKLECGKTRAIYSLDSDNYLRFDAPARALEKCWRGRRANLNPSRGSVSEDLEERMGKLRRWKMMFDYADFNSAHTIEAQRIVVEEAFSGLDDKWLKWLSESFEATYLRDPRDQSLRRTDGTLMSGHRMTSIINTILNAAYVRICVGEALYEKLTIEHVGDDIVASTDSTAVAAEVASRIGQSCLNMQREKQGFGEHCAEFLRISYTKGAAIGYLPRTISTMVCGSWVSEARLDGVEYANTLNAGIWALRNRACDRRAGALVRTTLKRRLGLSDPQAKGVCEGGASLHGGPVLMPRPGWFEMIELADASDTKKVPRAVGGVRLPRHAATAFREHSKEYADLVRAGVTRSMIDEVMLEASFSNVATVESECAPCVKTAKTVKTSHLMLRRRGCRMLLARDPPLGVIANLLKGRLSASVADRYSRIAGKPAHSLYAGTKAYNFPVSCDLGIPYQDAARAAYACPGGSHYCQQVVVCI